MWFSCIGCYRKNMENRRKCDTSIFFFTPKPWLWFFFSSSSVKQITENHADPETMLLSFLRDRRILINSYNRMIWLFTNDHVSAYWSLFLDCDFSEAYWNQVWLRRWRVWGMHGYGVALPTCHQNHHVSFMVNHMVQQPSQHCLKLVYAL